MCRKSEDVSFCAAVRLVFVKFFPQYICRGMCGHRRDTFFGSRVEIPFSCCSFMFGESSLKLAPCVLPVCDTCHFRQSLFEAIYTRGRQLTVYYPTAKKQNRYFFLSTCGIILEHCAHGLVVVMADTSGANVPSVTTLETCSSTAAQGVTLMARHPVFSSGRQRVACLCCSKM